MTEPKISIITVTYNSEKSIARLLSSIAKNLTGRYEVIVLDNNSTDRSVQIASKQPNVKVIQSIDNLGFSKGCNLAAKGASGDYLLFLNPDSELTPNVVFQLVDYLKNHPETGIVAPRLVQENGQTQPSVRNFPTIWRAVKEYYFGIKSAYDGFVPKVENPLSVDCVVGAAMLIPKNIFEKVGGFSQKYFMYYEDINLCLKVHKLGLKIIYLPAATIKHQVGGSFSPQKEKWLQDSAKIYHGLLGYWLLTILLKLRPLKR